MDSTKNSNACDHNPHVADGQTDGRTDGETYHGNTALHYASRSNNERRSNDETCFDTIPECKTDRREEPGKLPAIEYRLNEISMGV